MDKRNDDTQTSLCSRLEMEEAANKASDRSKLEMEKKKNNTTEKEESSRGLSSTHINEAAL